MKIKARSFKNILNNCFRTSSSNLKKHFSKQRFTPELMVGSVSVFHPMEEWKTPISGLDGWKTEEPSWL